MLRKALPLSAFALLAACQASPKQTVLNLDTTDPRWTSAECVAARRRAHAYDDKELTRAAAGVAGVAAAGPIAGAAAATTLSLGQDDEREDLNVQIRRACVTPPAERRAIAAEGRPAGAREPDE